MTAPASRLLLIACPVHGCGGWVRAVLTDPWTAEQRCPGCGVQFTVPCCEVPASGETTAPIALLRLPTYEQEHVQLCLDEAFRIVLTGRLDLFAAEGLAKVWTSLPLPRRTVFDLTQATELSPKGIAVLLGLCAPNEEDSRGVILLREGDAEQQRAFASNPLIHCEKNAALRALGAIAEESRRMLTVTIRREQTVSAPIQQPKGDNERGPAPEKPAQPASQPRRRRLEVEDIGDVAVVNFTDRKLLDEQNIKIIGDQLFSLVDEQGRRKILLNFGNVEYMSSAMHAKLITLNKKLHHVGGRLVLCNIDPQIYEVFEMTKLDRFYHIFRSEQEALQAF